MELLESKQMADSDVVEELMGKTMDEQDWEIRIVTVLGTVHDDENCEDEIMLPAVSYETLKVYHAFLMQELKCPFDAAYNRETGTSPCSCSS